MNNRTGRQDARWLIMGSVLATAAGFGGCQETPKYARDAFADYHNGQYAAAAARLKPEITRKDENYVLNNCRYGSATLAAGDLPEAQNAFMAAYQVMNSTKTNDAGRQMGAAVVWEGVKVWKGEPFEQAMAHYYLGVVFLMKHDYENARAAFENSLFQVREYASKDDIEHYKMADSTFALGYFGKGFCYLRMSKPDLAEASFKEALRCDPSLGQLVQDVQRPGVNTLLFVDLGTGPQKEPKGWYSEESAFGPSPAQVGPVPPITAHADGTVITRPQERYTMVDTLAMAQEKRWQDIDTLRKVKAVIGTGAMAAGTGMSAYGAANNNQGMFWGGLGAIALGAALAASSQADLRAWGMLPRTVYIIPATLPPGPHLITVEAAGHSSLQQQVTIMPTGGPIPMDSVFYYRLP